MTPIADDRLGAIHGVSGEIVIERNVFLKDNDDVLATRLTCLAVIRVCIGLLF
jgi:hypothetical protein